MGAWCTFGQKGRGADFGRRGVAACYREVGESRAQGRRSGCPRLRGSARVRTNLRRSADDVHLGALGRSMNWPTPPLQAAARGRTKSAELGCWRVECRFFDPATPGIRPKAGRRYAFLVLRGWG